jgi:hypothetical protein
MSDGWPWEPRRTIPEQYAPANETDHKRPPAPVPYVGGTTDGT